MFWIKPPAILGQIFRDAWWRMPDSGPSVYITFDDGPHPETTPFILDQLALFDFHATFFCLGRSVETYPGLYKNILAKGHQVGIHSYSHPNGWKANTASYLQDIDQAAEIIQSRLFRPPYGKLSWNQFQRLKEKYQLVMWSTMPEDYDPSVSDEAILHRLTEQARPGDIIVLHENDGSKEHIRQILPSYLSWLKDHGLTSKKLPDAG